MEGALQACGFGTGEKLEVTMPEECIGGIIGCISSRRGMIHSMIVKNSFHEVPGAEQW